MAHEPLVHPLVQLGPIVAHVHEMAADPQQCGQRNLQEGAFNGEVVRQWAHEVVQFRR